MKVGEIGLDKLTLTTQNFKVLDWGDKLWTPDSRDGEGKKQYEPKREDLDYISICIRCIKDVE